MDFLQAFVILGFLCDVIFTYPDGAASSACDSMQPFHRFDPQKIPPPFAIEVSTNYYGPNEKINVTLHAPCGRSMFKGFMLQARVIQPGDGIQRVGVFNSPAGSHFVPKCGTTGQAVTHGNNSLKASMQFEWTAPSDASGHMAMTATIVQDIQTFWVQLTSSIIKDNRLTAEVESEGKSFPTTPVDCSVFEKPSVRDEGCGRDKNCYVHCNGYTCELAMTWTQLGESDEVQFNVVVAVDKGDNRSMAIAFSDDDKLGNDSAIVCVSAEGETNVYMSYILESSVPLDFENMSSVSGETRVSLEKQILNCLFTLPLRTNISVNQLDLSEELYIIHSTGKTFTKSFAVDAIVSPTRFQFWKKAEVSTASTRRTRQTTPDNSATTFPYRFSVNVVASHLVFFTVFRHAR